RGRLPRPRSGAVPVGPRGHGVHGARRAGALARRGARTGVSQSARGRAGARPRTRSEQRLHPRLRSARRHPLSGCRGRLRARARGRVGARGGAHRPLVAAPGARACGRHRAGASHRTTAAEHRAARVAHDSLRRGTIMSAPSGAPKGAVTRLVQAVSLVTVFGLLYGAARFSPPLREHLGEIAAIGFLLLSGTLLSELLETVGLPHLSGYLLAGVLAGPHVLHLVDHHTVERLSPVNTLALALIAIAGGAELRVATLKSVARSVAWALLLQCAIGLVVMALAFLAVSRWVPFARDLSIAPLIGVALLWGTLAVSRSPSACLAILSQTRAKGPVATFSLAFIMASDVVVVVLMALVMTF